MSKMRGYELAKLLEMNNKDLLTLLEKVSVPVKSHMSTIDDDAIQLVEEEVEKSKKKKTSSGKSAPAKAEPEKKAPAPKAGKGESKTPAPAAAETRMRAAAEMNGSALSPRTDSELRPGASRAHRGTNC